MAEWSHVLNLHKAIGHLVDATIPTLDITNVSGGWEAPDCLVHLLDLLHGGDLEPSKLNLLAGEFELGW
jgi:hypothetical protein